MSKKGPKISTSSSSNVGVITLQNGHKQQSITDFPKIAQDLIEAASTSSNKNEHTDIFDKFSAYLTSQRFATHILKACCDNLKMQSQTIQVKISENNDETKRLTTLCLTKRINAIYFMLDCVIPKHADMEEIKFVLLNLLWEDVVFIFEQLKYTCSLSDKPYKNILASIDTFTNCYAIFEKYSPMYTEFLDKILSSKKTGLPLHTLLEIKKYIYQGYSNFIVIEANTAFIRHVLCEVDAANVALAQAKQRLKVMRENLPKIIACAHLDKKSTGEVFEASLQKRIDWLTENLSEPPSMTVRSLKSILSTLNQSSNEFLAIINTLCHHPSVASVLEDDLLVKEISVPIAELTQRIATLTSAKLPLRESLNLDTQRHFINAWVYILQIDRCNKSQLFTVLPQINKLLLACRDFFLQDQSLVLAKVLAERFEDITKKAIQSRLQFNKAPKPEASSSAIQEAELKAEQEAKLKAEQEAKLKAEQEAKLKAEQEAKLKAEQEAKLKAEREAKLKAEQEAKLKAEREAKLKAEQTAKRKAEEEAARRKAEEEAAKRKAEEEAARLKAEEEAARLKAEEEAARLKAEEEAAKRKAEEELIEQLKALALSSCEFIPVCLPFSPTKFTIQIPQSVQNILATLNRQGYWAVLVGGAVRDGVLNAKPNDFDIITNCPKEKLTNILRINSNESIFVPGLFEFDTEDEHEIDLICTERSLIDELKTRDLTINTLIADRHGKVYDLLGNSKDLFNYYLVMMGDIQQRLIDDPARICRIVQTCSHLGKSISPEYVSAMQQHAHLITKKLGFGAYVRILESLFLKGNAKTNVNTLLHLGLMSFLTPCGQFIKNDLRFFINFLKQKSYHFDKMGKKTRKSSLNGYHIIALLLIPELLDQISGQEMLLSEGIDNVLNNFCLTYQANTAKEKSLFKSVKQFMINYYSEYINSQARYAAALRTSQAEQVPVMAASFSSSSSSDPLPSTKRRSHKPTLNQLQLYMEQAASRSQVSTETKNKESAKKKNGSLKFQ